MERPLDTREGIRVVTANNFLKAANLETISVKARKLLYLAIAQCRRDDEEFFEYKIKAKEFADLMGIQVNHVYQEADALTDELMQGFMKCVPPGETKFRKFKLCTCDYDDGVLTIQLDKDMTPILLNLKRDFTQPLLSDFMKMRSNYSMTIWHLMQREMRSKKTGVTDIVCFDLTLQELRSATGTIDKFERLSQFKAKVLDKAINEIKVNCGVLITYKYTKSGRTVTGFHFTARSLYYVDESEIPERVKKQIAEGKRRIAAEQQKRGISPTLTPEPEELPLPEPHHSRPLTQMEKEQYNRQTKDAEQLNLFSFLENQ